MRAKKSLGQNFLTDTNICRRIVDALGSLDDVSVLEIGPGRGALTQWIHEAAPKRFMVVEKDDTLSARLVEDYIYIEMRHMDAREFPWEDLESDGPWKVAGNLPYNIASPLIWDFVSRGRGWERAVFMVQHEVAKRLTAEPGSKAYGGLTVWVKNFAKTRYLFKVPPTVFKPQPKVDSAVVEFLPEKRENFPGEPEVLAEFVKMCFQKRRKQLGNILKSMWSYEIEQWFEGQGIQRTARPETLTPEQFRSLATLVTQHFSGKSD